MTVWDRSNPRSPSYVGPYGWTGNTQTDIATHYPGMNLLMGNGELRDLITRAANEQWPAERLESAFYGSQFYQTNTLKRQEWQKLGAAEKKIRTRDTAAAATEYFRQLYGDINAMRKIYPWATSWDAVWNHLAVHSGTIGNIAAGNMSWEQWQTLEYNKAIRAPGSMAMAEEMQRQERLARMIKRPEELGEQLWQQAHGEYFLPLDKKSAVKWANDIIQGRSSFGEFQDYMRGQAAKMFPMYKDSIMNGILPGQLFAPALNVLAQELETSPDAVKANQKLWNEIALQGGQSKEPFTASDWIQYARAMPEWKGTKRAQEMASGFTEEILKRFGAIG